MYDIHNNNNKELGKEWLLLEQSFNNLLELTQYSSKIDLDKLHITIPKTTSKIITQIYNKGTITKKLKDTSEKILKTKECSKRKTEGHIKRHEANRKKGKIEEINSTISIITVNVRIYTLSDWILKTRFNYMLLTRHKQAESKRMEKYMP